MVTFPLWERVEDHDGVSMIIPVNCNEAIKWWRAGGVV